MTTQPTPKVRTIKGSPFPSVEILLRRLETPAQYFEVDPTRKSTIVGASGTRLTIFPQSFCDSQDRILDKPASLQLREVFSRKDILLSNKMTTSENRLLESAGQLWLSASYEGQVLDLVYPIGVDLPVKSGLRNPLAVRLFSGGAASTHSISPKVSFDWRQVDKKNLPITHIANKKYYRFWLYQFNWINCNNSISRRKGRSMVSAKAVSRVEEFDDLMAFLVLSNSQSMARMHRTNDHFTAFNIPSKLSAKVLMIGLHQGIIYFGLKEIEKTTNSLVYVRMEPVSLNGLSQKLDSIG